jgi:hypothetical protein
MIELVSQYAAIVLLFIGIFYSLVTASGVFNLYLRRIEHLPIDQSDKKAIQSSTLRGLLFLSAAYLLRYATVDVLLVTAICVLLTFQMRRISTLIKKLS